MKLKSVSIAGIDDGIDLDQLFALGTEYLFVEWSFLLRAYGKTPSPLYPELDWMGNFLRKNHESEVAQNLSLHVCGGAITELFQEQNNLVHLLCGETGEKKSYRTRIDDLEGFWSSFKRIQLNFVARKHRAFWCDIPAILNEIPGEHQFVFQILSKKLDPDGENIVLGNNLRDMGFDIVFLHDTSGGYGIATEQWLPPVGDYCGYAGGLVPETLEKSLQSIAAVVGGTSIWIDMQSGVRTDERLDLDKVRQVLKISSKWMT